MTKNLRKSVLPRFCVSGLLLSVLMTGGYASAQADARVFLPADETNIERTAVYLSMAENIQYGYPMGVVVLEQQKDGGIFRFEVSDLIPGKGYRIDVYDGGSCHVLPPYSDKEWQAALGSRIDLEVGTLIKSGEPLAMIFATELGMVRSAMMLPQYQIRNLYDKALVIREGQSLKGKIVACGEIVAGQPVPIDDSKGIKVIQGDSSDNRRKEVK